MRYRLNSDGTKTPIAGRGKAEYGASTVRIGTVTNVAVSVESTAVANITFTTAMPDANYLVNISECNYGIPTFSITEKTKTGFKVVIYNPTTITLSDLSFNYTAFKLYTDTEYNKLLTVQSGTTSDEHVTWNRSGNVVTVSIYNFVGTGSNVTVTGLPKCGGYVLANMCASGTSTPTGAIQISKNDTSAIIYGVPNGTAVFGSVTYITSDPL